MTRTDQAIIADARRILARRYGWDVRERAFENEAADHRYFARRRQTQPYAVGVVS